MSKTHLLINAGFNYLSEMKRDQIPLSSHRVIEEAIDLSNYLIDKFRAESERRYITPSGAY